ncbi:MAG: hypothetical protein Q9170_001286 [Blastenia crenularia]
MTSSSINLGANLGGTQIGQQILWNEPRNRLLQITDWFSPLNFIPKQNDVYKDEYANSKQAFFEAKEFKDWTSGKLQVLWCHGIAGSGKTVLTSMVYEHLRSVQSPHAGVGIACIYCDNQQKRAQTPGNLLASTWRPLHLGGNKDNVLPTYMDHLYSVHEATGTRPGFTQIQDVIRSAVKDLEHAYILVDGLDECSDFDHQEMLMESVKALLATSNTHGIKLQVLVTSRLKDRYLEDISTPIRILASDDEVTSMVKARIKTPNSFHLSLRKRIQQSQELQTTIVDRVVSQAKGVFLIAHLHISSLRKPINISDLRETLEQLPTTLDQYWEGMWVKTSNQDESLVRIAHRTLTWLCSSQRQLKAEELRHALAVQPGMNVFDIDRMTEIVAIVETCHGLVDLEENSKTVKLVHATVLEYLQKQRSQLFQNSSAYLTTICLTYLSLDVFCQRHCEFATSEDVDIHASVGEQVSRWRILSYRLLEYPFLDYAAENWGYHARGDPEKSCRVRLWSFLFSMNPLNNAHTVHAQVFHPSQRRHVSNDCTDLFPFRVAISFGLEITVCDLSMISKPAAEDRPEVRIHWLLSLFEAIEAGQPKMVSALLDAGVDPSSSGEAPPTVLEQTLIYQDEGPKTALDRSVFHGHNDITSLLLAKEIDISITDTTMQYAVVAEDMNVLTRYLTSATASTISSNRILHFATEKGSLKSVQFSLKKGASIESRDDVYEVTALGLAVMHGQSDLVEFLLIAGADASVEVVEDSDDGPELHTLLYGAVTSQRLFRRRLELVNEFALKYSSAEIKDKATVHFLKHLTAWMTMEPRPLKLLQNADFLGAVREDSDHVKIISMLLNHGADISERGENDENLLHLAVSSTPRVETLLQYLDRNPDANLDVNGRDNNGRTPLHYAAVTCNPAAMELMIKHGANVLTTDDFEVSTLHFSVHSPRCIRLAAEHGCDVHTAHRYLGTPLQFANASDMCEHNKHSIEMLENLMTEKIETGDKETEQSQRNEGLLKADSTEFRMIDSWIMRTKDQHSILCHQRIRTYLRGSQQEGYMKMIEGHTATPRDRTWTLIEV